MKMVIDIKVNNMVEDLPDNMTIVDMMDYLREENMKALEMEYGRENLLKIYSQLKKG